MLRRCHRLSVNVPSGAIIIRSTPARPAFPKSLHTPSINLPRSYSNMASTQSHACCTVPPVVSSGYSEKGEWTTINGMKTYATGPKDAKTALLIVYDIFGFFPQTLQGADILAYGDKERQYQVFMPGE